MSDPSRYLEDLDAQLARVGIRGARRTRIVTELADHLSCDADANLGDPATLAAAFADELGTSFARSAALQAFAALVLAGLLVVVRAIALPPLTGGGLGTGETVGLLVAGLSAQVALVAGGLGLLRAIRFRGRGTIPREEAFVLARRAGVGLAAGAVTILAFPIAQPYRAHPGVVAIGGHAISPWWPLASAGSLLALAIAAHGVVRAARLRPQTSGPAGDLIADLGPLGPIAARVTGGSVNRLAVIVAAVLLVVIALSGVAVGDPYDAILRGLLESGAFLSGYSVLGRYLSIRS
jgi:hypothetical protein